MLSVWQFVGSIFKTCENAIHTRFSLLANTRRVTLPKHFFYAMHIQRNVFESIFRRKKKVLLDTSSRCTPLKNVVLVFFYQEKLFYFLYQFPRI